MGQRATFVRLAGCPVGCIWCDTRYSWDPAARNEPTAAAWRVEDLLDHLFDLTAHNGDLVIITGGEPLAQAEALRPLVAGLAGAGRRVHLETAGVHKVDPGLLDYFDLIVVSPKLTNAGVQAVTQRRLDVLQRMAERPGTWFKFVVAAVEELDEVQAILRDLNTRQVMVMAEGVDREASLALTRELAEPVIARGWSLSPRLHIWLWGDERGR